MGKIEGPSTITFGQVATFKDASSEATSWSWEFGETGKTDATEKEAKYMYKSPGMKEVRLMINGTGKSTTMKVFVKPMPAPNPGGGGASKKAPAITESQFIQKLKDIIAKKEKGVTIFAPYVCSYTDLPITVNGQGMSFNSYCTGLRVNGELVKNISAAKLSVDPATGCITNIAITQEKNAE
jgi:hypothetical protein